MSPVASGGHSSGGIDPVTLRRFWDEGLELTDRVDPKPRLDRRESARPFEEFDVEFTGVGGVRVRGRLSRPLGLRTPLPAVLTAPGFAGWEQGLELAECQRGYAIFQAFPRGQGESYDALPIAPSAKLTSGLDDPRSHYYRFAFLDLVVAVTLLTQLDGIDGERIAAVGTSQGGGLALAVAALDARVRAVVANLPFLCAIRRAAGEPGSVVSSVLTEAGLQSAESLVTLDYFDAVYLAPWIRCPTLVISGGADRACPSDGVHDAYERLGGIRSEIHDPSLAHERSQLAYDATWWWLRLHLGRTG